MRSLYLKQSFHSTFNTIINIKELREERIIKEVVPICYYTNITLRSLQFPVQYDLIIGDLISDNGLKRDK